MTLEKDPLAEARQIALHRLDRRECSTGDITQCLKRKKFPSDIITQVVSELVEKKYINNEKYARIVVREQALRGKGPNWIKMKLKEKGISTEREAIEVLMRDVADTSELNVARAVVSRRYPQVRENEVIAKKAIQALLRRGFSYGIAREALATFDQDLQDS
jgi:regulatory protein